MMTSLWMSVASAVIPSFPMVLPYANMLAIGMNVLLLLCVAALLIDHTRDTRSSRQHTKASEVYAYRLTVHALRIEHHAVR